MRDVTTVTCTANAIVDLVEFPDGTKMAAVPYHDPDGRRCHDCNIAEGGFHHPGCDMEVCPRCGGQIISCGCLDDGEEEEDY